MATGLHRSTSVGNQVLLVVEEQLVRFGAPDQNVGPPTLLGSRLMESSVVLY